MSELVVRERNGACYVELLRSVNTQHVSTAVVDDKCKLVYPEAVFTVDAVLGSYKYGCELQFKAYTFKPPKLERRVDKEHSVYRLECGYLPLSHETAEALRRVADEVDALIGYGGVKVTAGCVERLEDLLL